MTECGLLPTHTEWTACYTNDSKTHVQLRVGFTDKNTTFTYPNVAAGRPTVIYAELSVYGTASDGKEADVARIVYDVERYEEKLYTDATEKWLEIPAGVHCAMASTAPLPPLPTNFSIDIEYIDPAAKTITDHRVIYANEPTRKIFAFTWAKASTLLPWAMAASECVDPAKVGAGWIIHDVDYGLAYVLTKDGATCTGTHRITDKFVDVLFANTSVSLVDATELIAKGTSNSYVYNGVRSTTDDVKTDVYSALGKDKNVYEVQFMNDFTRQLQHLFVYQVGDAPIG